MMKLVSIYELLVFPHMIVDDGEIVNLMWHLGDNHNIITKETCDAYISWIEYNYDYDIKINQYGNYLCRKADFLVSFQCKSISHPTDNDKAWRYNYLYIGDRV